MIRNFVRLFGWLVALSVASACAHLLWLERDNVEDKY
jgi:hypothetical protein